MSHARFNWTQVKAGRTRPTKKERRALFGFGVSGNEAYDQGRPERNRILLESLDPYIWD